MTHLKIAPATILLSVAVVGAISGFMAYRHYSLAHSRMAQSGLIPIAMAPAAPAAATATLPASAIPEEVPDVRLQDLAGKLHALRDDSGQPHLYNFWATWCEPCRREIPLLNALQHTYRADHLQIVGIAVDFRDAVRDFLKTTKLNYKSLVGEEEGLEAAQKFGMEMALPFSVFADERNRIVAVKVGELHLEEADAILANMRDLRAGQATLAEARARIAERLKQAALQRAKQSKPN